MSPVIGCIVDFIYNNMNHRGLVIERLGNDCYIVVLGSASVYSINQTYCKVHKDSSHFIDLSRD